MKHVDKDHVVAFNSVNQLIDSFEGKPILNKLGLIVKTRNGIIKARTILDTKRSGVKRMTAKAEGVTLPRLLTPFFRCYSYLLQ